MILHRLEIKLLIIVKNHAKNLTFLHKHDKINVYFMKKRGASYYNIGELYGKDNRFNKKFYRAKKSTNI